MPQNKNGKYQKRFYPFDLEWRGLYQISEETEGAGHILPLQALLPLGREVKIFLKYAEVLYNDE